MAKTDSKEYLFEQAPVAKAIAALAIPTILSQLVMVIYSLADTFWVGMLNDPLQNAAVTIASPALLAFNTLSNLFGVGASSMMSRALGRKDYDTVYRSSAFGFYCAAFFAMLFSLAFVIFGTPLLKVLGADETTFETSVSYLRWTVMCGAVPAVLSVTIAHLVRAEGSSLHASIGTMSGCALNIILDPIFILPWGLNMGVGGAGLATFISNCVACVYFVILLIKKRGKTYVCVHPKKFSFDKKIVSNVMEVGIPSALMNFLSVTGMTVLNNFTAGYGADAVAAMGICNKIYMVPLNLTYGIAQGAMPLIGYNYAAGAVKRVRKTISYTRFANVSVIVIVGILFFAFPRFFVSLFINDETVIMHGMKLLRRFSIALPFLSLDFFTVAVFQAAGLGKEAFVFAILRKLVLEIPGLYLYNRIIGLYGLPFAQLTAEVILTIASFLILRKIYRRMEEMYPEGENKERIAEKTK